MTVVERPATSEAVMPAILAGGGGAAWPLSRALKLAEPRPPIWAAESSPIWVSVRPLAWVVLRAASWALVTPAIWAGVKACIVVESMLVKFVVERERS